MNYCIYCGHKLQQHEKFCIQCGAGADGKNPPQESHKETKNIVSEEHNSYKFKTLLGYGNLLTAVGWFLMGVGVIAFLAAIVLREDVQRLTAAISGIAFLLYGFPLVIIGQAVSCFVEIEKNTRLTYTSLRRLQTV